MNPFDVLTVPPALLKRAVDDLHEIAELVRRYLAVEDVILVRVARLEADLAGTRAGLERLEAEIVAVRRAAEALPVKLDELEEELQGVRASVQPLPGKLDGLAAEMAPIQHLAAIRSGIEPLEHSMVAVRNSVDELEPMIAGLDRRVQEIDPKLEDMRDSVEPIGDLAERLPGNRKRRQ